MNEVNMAVTDVTTDVTDVTNGALDLDVVTSAVIGNNENQTIFNATENVILGGLVQNHIYIMHFLHGCFHLFFFVLFMILYRWVKTKLPIRRPLPSLPVRERTPFELALADPTHRINVENTYIEPQV